MYKAIEVKANKIDQNLIQSVRAHLKKSTKAFEAIQHKLRKAELKNLSEWTEQIERLQGKLFPGGTWQERRDSFLNYYPQNAQFINDLLAAFDPLAFDMNFLILEENAEV